MKFHHPLTDQSRGLLPADEVFCEDPGLLVGGSSKQSSERPGTHMLEFAAEVAEC